MFYPFVSFWNASSMLMSSFCKVLIMRPRSTDHLIRLARMSVSPCGSRIQWLSFTCCTRPTCGMLRSRSSLTSLSNSTMTTLLVALSCFRFSILSSATTTPILIIMARSQMASTSCMMWVESSTVFSLPRLEMVGIETGGGLVKDEHLRVVHHGLGEADALAVAFRQGTDFLVCLKAESCLVNHCLNALVGGFAFQLVDACHKLKVFAHIHVKIQRVVFRQVAHDTLHCHRVVHDVVSFDAHRTRSGRDEAGDDLHQRRLACAVGAEQSDDTFINRERDVIEGELLAVALGDMVDFDGHLRWFWSAKIEKIVHSIASNQKSSTFATSFTHPKPVFRTR